MNKMHNLQKSPAIELSDCMHHLIYYFYFIVIINVLVFYFVELNCCERFHLTCSSKVLPVSCYS